MSRTTPLRLNRDGFVLRMDFVESAKSQWSGRYSWGRRRGNPRRPSTSSGSKITTGYEQYLGSNTRILSPNIVNEARFGYSRFYNALDHLSGVHHRHRCRAGSSQSNWGPPVTWGIPSVAFNGDGFSGFGDNTDGPYENKNNTTQFIDNVSWNQGQAQFQIRLRI